MGASCSCWRIHAPCGGPDVLVIDATDDELTVEIGPERAHNCCAMCFTLGLACPYLTATGFVDTLQFSKGGSAFVLREYASREETFSLEDITNVQLRRRKGKYTAIVVTAGGRNSTITRGWSNAGEAAKRNVARRIREFYGFAEEDADAVPAAPDAGPARSAPAAPPRHRPMPTADSGRSLGSDGAKPAAAAAAPKQRPAAGGEEEYGMLATGGTKKKKRKKRSKRKKRPLEEEATGEWE